ncbi:MAG: hypothetical protein WCI64_11565 [Chlorobium sp.]
MYWWWIHGIKETKRDLIIGIEVASWDEFRSLTDTLLERGHFFPSTFPHCFKASSSTTLI